jgi:hypothetical protein
MGAQMTASTKPQPVRTEPANAAPNKGGRPPINGKAMSSTERSARRRARKRQAAPPKPIKEQMAGVNAEAVLAELISTRNLVSPLHKSIAFKVAKALARDDAVKASRWLEFLPPAVRVEGSSAPGGLSDAKQRFLAGVMNAVAADRIERRQRAERGETLSQRDRLQLQIDLLDEREALPAPDESAAGEPADEVSALRARIAELEARLAEGDGVLVEDMPRHRGGEDGDIGRSCAAGRSGRVP